MDESEYADPRDFRPERWLDNKFGTKRKESDAANDNRRVMYAFGAGRRVCSGQRLAENSLVCRLHVVFVAPAEAGLGAEHGLG